MHFCSLLRSLIGINDRTIFPLSYLFKTASPLGFQYYWVNGGS